MNAYKIVNASQILFSDYVEMNTVPLNEFNMWFLCHSIRLNIKFAWFWNYPVPLKNLISFTFEWFVVQEKERGGLIEIMHKSDNPPVSYPTTYHFVTEMHTCGHISVIKWCILGYLFDAFVLINEMDLSIAVMYEASSWTLPVVIYRPTRRIIPE